MAFKQWTTKEGSDLVPWVDVYIEHNPNMVGKCLDVRDVKLKTKGLILETDVCAAYVYKSKLLYKHVVEFIEGWCSAKQPSPIMQIMLTQVEPFWCLGVDDERQGGWSLGEDKKYWHQHYQTAEDNPDWSHNPLPLPTKSPSMREPRAHPSKHALECDLPTTPETSQDLALEGSGNGVKPPKGRKGHPSP